MSKCKFCEKELSNNQIKNGNDFCSRKCANKFRAKPRGNCVYCGSRLDKAGKKFCSRKCYSKHRTKDNVKRNAKGEVLHKINCIICDSIFYNRNQHIKTCSKKCLYKLRSINTSGKNNPKYKGPITKKCAYCGKTFSYPRTEAHKKYCSDYCQNWGSARNRRKQNHWRYKGDTKRDRGPNWSEQKTKARRRDNYTCQECGIEEREIDELLSVHHITPYCEFDDWKKANELSNLISLCRSCHVKVELRN